MESGLVSADHALLKSGAAVVQNEPLVETLQKIQNEFMCSLADTFQHNCARYFSYLSTSLLEAASRGEHGASVKGPIEWLSANSAVLTETPDTMETAENIPDSAYEESVNRYLAAAQCTIDPDCLIKAGDLHVLLPKYPSVSWTYG